MDQATPSDEEFLKMLGDQNLIGRLIQVAIEEEKVLDLGFAGFSQMVPLPQDISKEQHALTKLAFCCGCQYLFAVLVQIMQTSETEEESSAGFSHLQNEIDRFLRGPMADYNPLLRSHPPS